MMKQLIKCNLSGKSLKLLFFSLLTSCFIFLGSSSVNAGYSQLIGIEGYPSYYDINFTVSFLKGGGLLSSLLGQGKNLLAIDNNTFIWWAPNGFLYYYSQGVNFTQGFFDRFYSCDLITDFTSNAPGNCTVAGYIAFSGEYVDSNREIFKGFFSTLTGGDFVFYDHIDEQVDSPTTHRNRNRALICWSSQSVGKSLCFNGGFCYGSCSASQSDMGSLINSQNLRDNMTFSSISTAWLGSAPGQFGYANQVPTTGGIGSPVVNQQTTFDALYKQGYRSQMCYGGFGLDDLVPYNGTYFTGIQLGSGATIFELYDTYGDGRTFSDWYDQNWIDYLYLSSFNSAEDLEYFVGKSKGLVGLGIVRETLFKGDNFNPFGLRTFCQYYFSGVGLSATVNPSLTDQQIQDTIFNDIVGNIGVLIPIDGSPLGTLFESVYSNTSGSSSVNPDCLNGDLNSCLMSSGFSDSLDLMWRSWSVSGIKEGVNGILPGYIVLGFLGILLLYYIRR